MLALLIGIAMAVGGGLMVIKVQKRNFERTNAAGVLEFDSFKDSYKFGLQNRLMKGLGSALLIIGIIIFSISLSMLLA